MACTVEPICKLQKELANFDDITTTFMNKHSSLNMSQSPLRFQSLADVKNRLLSEKHASMKPFRPKKVTSKLLDGGQRFDARTENFMAMVVVCTTTKKGGTNHIFMSIQNIVH